MATSRINLTYLDRLGKASGPAFHSTTLTAGNFTAQMGLLDDLVAAIADVTLLNLQKDQRVAIETKFAVSLPTDPGAVKGVKWLVRMTDSNGNSVTAQIPGADLTLDAGGGKMDLTAGEGAALVSAIEAVVKSNDGEAVTVQEIIYLDK